MMKYDILIAGSGFAGSLAALCLDQAGFNVCIIEKSDHPRFAIGESSTPVADMILRDLANQYDLPWLKHLTRYGSWQEHYPEITCGIKRGFSYYKHQQGKKFYSDQDHTNELLVAASVDDYNSDTQWLRSDVDQFLIKKAEEAGISYFAHTDIRKIDKDSSGSWVVSAKKNEQDLIISTGFMIDATGSSSFSEKFFGTRSSSDLFETHTRAIYSHFSCVPRWMVYLEAKNFKTDDYPYNPDHSALHHILDEGWLWMLRFNNDLLSAGIVIDQNNSWHNPSTSVKEEWHYHLKKYPSLDYLFKKSKLATEPGKILGTGRLQRRLDRLFGKGWATLYHTAGFVDPLHSTGIAHSLSGVEKILKILTRYHQNQTELDLQLNSYQDEFFNELELIDLLISGCYKSRYHFDLFTAWSMLYFTCTIRYEQSRMCEGTTGDFLSAGNTPLRKIVGKKFRSLQKLIDTRPGKSARLQFLNEIRESIKPFNTSGLMDTEKKNMYQHTAVKL